MDDIFFNQLLKDSLHIDPTRFEDMQKLAEAIREAGLKKRLETLRLQVLQGLSNGTLTTSDDVYVEYTNLKKQLLT